MTTYSQPEPATDAALALYARLGAWIADGIHADPLTRSRDLDAIKEDAHVFLCDEMIWERRRLVLQMRVEQTLAAIAEQIGYTLAALHQWQTGDRRGRATGRFVGITTKPKYVSKRGG